MLSEAGMCRYRYKYYENTEEVALRDFGLSWNEIAKMPFLLRDYVCSIR